MARQNTRKPAPQRGPRGPQPSSGALASDAGGAATLAPEVRAMAVAEAPAVAGEAAPSRVLGKLEARVGARRLDLLIALGFVAIALVLYFWRIEAPWNGNRPYIYDEVYHAYTAAQWVKGNTDPWLWTTKAPDEGFAYEWTHPPLGKEIIAVGIYLFGDNRFGWRFTSVLFGAAGIGLIYWLGLALTRRRVAACLFAILTLVDGLYFVESRAGLLDIYGAVFMVGAFLAFYAYLKAPADRVRWPLLGLGLGLGLAIATKWNAAYGAAVIGIAVMLRVGYLLLLAVGATRRALLWALAAVGIAVLVAANILFRHNGGGQRLGLTAIIIIAVAVLAYLVQEGTIPADAGRDERAAYRRGFFQHLIWVPLGLAVLPAAIYMLSYGPFFGAGFSLQQFRDLHWQMYYYHSHLTDPHPYGSRWWYWPLTKRPVWYGVEYFPENGTVARTYANGNPLLYWSFFVAVPYSISLLWQRTRYRELLVLLIGFFGQWLPWALISRIAYSYHFLPAAIFGALAVALFADDLWQFGDRQAAAGRPALWRYLAIGYVLAIVAAFVFFYPIYASWALTDAEFDARIWISTWR